jgi:hypothetical protein
MSKAETKYYIPPQSPVAIQPGDKGFEIVGKAYNRWIGTFKDWVKGRSKIINPKTNWGINSIPMTPNEMKKKMKNLYLKEDNERIKGGLSSGKDIYDIAKLHAIDKSEESINKMVEHLKKQLIKGTGIEMEHTVDKGISQEIALDHLYEDPDYYLDLEKIEENMENIKNYKNFINESALLESEVISTSIIDLPEEKNIKGLVVKQVTGTGTNERVLKGALRFQGGPKGPIDYLLNIKIPLTYTGPVVPSKFWKSKKGDYYVIQTNVKGQQQDIEPDDMKLLISGYKSGKSKIIISRKFGIVLTFSRTFDFKNK